LDSASFKNNLQIIYGGGSSYSSYDPTSPFNSLTSLEPNRAYLFITSVTPFQLWQTTVTSTPTPTTTQTVTPTNTATTTVTPTVTPTTTTTPTNTITPTNTVTSTKTPTQTATVTPTLTPTLTLFDFVDSLTLSTNNSYTANHGLTFVANSGDQLYYNNNIEYLDLPSIMNVSISGIVRATTIFPINSYLGKPFKFFLNTNNTYYIGYFSSGNINFS
jgi:hypothetical protein